MATSEELFREFLLSLDLGIDVDQPGMKDTPGRVVRMYKELLTPPPFEATTFQNDSYDALITVRDIAFASLCEHHLLPFIGVAHVCYLPNGRVLGLSKLARFVDKHARALQMQERMTNRIAHDINETLHPQGVGVVVDARHLCMELRGARKPGATTRTSTLIGSLLENPSLKEEFFNGLG